MSVVIVTPLQALWITIAVIVVIVVGGVIVWLKIMR